jgi:hypothetical protein
MEPISPECPIKSHVYFKLNQYKQMAMANHIIFMLGTKPNETHPYNRDLILSDLGDSLVNHRDWVFRVNL